MRAYIKRSRARSREGALPKKKTYRRWRCSRKKSLKRWCPEIKLVKLIIAFKLEKYTVQSLLCWSTFIVNSWKPTPLQQDTTYLYRLFSSGWKGKNELMNSSMVQLYYSSTFNYVQLNYNNINVKISFCPLFSTWLPTLV